MNKYNVKILDEAKDDMKEIIIYIKTKLKEPEIAVYYSGSNWQKNLKYR